VYIVNLTLSCGKLTKCLLAEVIQRDQEFDPSFT